MLRQSDGNRRRGHQMKFAGFVKMTGIRIALAADRIRAEVRGVAAVEFAFIAPIMLLLFVGTIELSAGVSVNRKLSRLSSTIGDLVTQSQSLTQNDIENIMDVSKNVMYPYDDQSITIVVSGIDIDADGNTSVVWSCSRPAGNGLPVGSPYTVPTKIKVPDTFLVAANITTSYTPSFGWAQYSASSGISFDQTSIPMEEELFLRPRIGRNVAVSCT